MRHMVSSRRLRIVLGLLAWTAIWHGPSVGDVSPDIPPEATLAAACSCDEPADDPAADGWNSEVFSQQAGKILDRLFGGLRSALPADAASLSALVTDDFQAACPRDSELTAVFQENGLRIERGPGQVLEASADAIRGALGAEALLKSIRGVLQFSGPVIVKVKITRIEWNETHPKATALLSLGGHAEGQSLQAQATLHCDWRIDEASTGPQLARISMERFERASLSAPSGSLFREQTPSAMEQVPGYREQLLFDSDYWAQRVESRLGSDYMGYHGVCVGDVNGDLLDDVYLCQPGGIPNLMLVQQPDGTVRDIAAQAGLDVLDSSRAALMIDLENDGDQDLVLSTATGTLLFENKGNTAFEFRQRFREGRLGYSLAAADFDQDQDLDVYVCMYHSPPEALVGNPLPYHDANNGSPNVLLANEGNWKFRNVTRDVGLDQNNQRWSYAASWEDFDNDGDPDLYVANDFGRNNLYRNDGGRFIDIAAQAGVEDIASGMSVIWGDPNRDGNMDVYVSNMFSSAGGRIAYQRQFQASAGEEARRNLQRLARGNSLFQNRGGGLFDDVTLDARVEMGRWAWGAGFLDLNNDGWEDLFVTNGNYTGEDTGDL